MDAHLDSRRTPIFYFRMSDIVEQLDPGSLAEACAFAWQVLREMNRETTMA